MLQTPANPGGLPLKTFDEMRDGLTRDRSQFYRDLSAPFYGANRPNAELSQGVRDAFWLWSMQVGLKGAYDCVKAFSETDFTDDLRQIERPTLIVHGDDDQIVPIADSALLSAKLIRGAALEVYEGAPHGLTATHKNRLNADLLGFLGARGRLAA
jgi:non-heme chloroperoxidase